MRKRGADSPRSASPMGPAPTRLPRIAFPLATIVAPQLVEGRCRAGRTGAPQIVSPDLRRGQEAGPSGLEQQAQAHDRGDPHDADADGEPVEVAFDDRRATER